MHSQFVGNQNRLAPFNSLAALRPQFLAKHERHQLLFGGGDNGVGQAFVGGRHIHSPNQRASPQNDHLIAEFNDILQLVRNQQDNHALVSRQLSQRLKQNHFLLGGNASGRLIQNQRLDPQSQQTNDLQLLPLGDKQTVNRLMRIKRKAKAPRQLVQGGFGLPPSQSDAFAAAIDEVFQHGKGTDIQRVLLKHTDAVGDGRRRPQCSQ